MILSNKKMGNELQALKNLLNEEIRNKQELEKRYFQEVKNPIKISEEISYFKEETQKYANECQKLKKIQENLDFENIVLKKQINELIFSPQKLSFTPKNQKINEILEEILSIEQKSVVHQVEALKVFINLIKK